MINNKMKARELIELHTPTEERLKTQFAHGSDAVGNAKMLYIYSLAGERATMRALALQLITSCRSAEP